MGDDVAEEVPIPNQVDMIHYVIRKIYLIKWLSSLKR